MTARFTELLAADADGVHRSCVCGADGVEASELDIQQAVSELLLDRLQLDVHTLTPFTRLRDEVERQGYDAVLVREPRLALWVRPSRTQLVTRLYESSTAELPSPITFDGDERDRVLMLRLPPRPGSGALLVDAEPVRVGTVRAYLRDSGGVQPTTWAHFTDDAWATHVSLADASAFARWCCKRVPNDEEWERLVDVAEHLKTLGEIWEWTSTPHPRGGHVVRGGPWRDRAGRGSPPNRSREDRAGLDVGVRLVRDG